MLSCLKKNHFLLKSKISEDMRFYQEKKPEFKLQKKDTVKEQAKSPKIKTVLKKKNRK